MRLLAFLVAVTAMTTFCGTSSASVIILVNPNTPFIPLPDFSRGDFNANGTVDGEDLVYWTQGFGQPVWRGMTGTSGDANSDSVTDGNDFLAWQRNAVRSSPSNATVPEPSAIVLAGGALVWLASSRRRQK